MLEFPLERETWDQGMPKALSAISTNKSFKMKARETVQLTFFSFNKQKLENEGEGAGSAHILFILNRKLKFFSAEVSCN